MSTGQRENKKYCQALKLASSKSEGSYYVTPTILKFNLVQQKQIYLAFKNHFGEHVEFPSNPVDTLVFKVNSNEMKTNKVTNYCMILTLYRPQNHKIRLKHHPYYHHRLLHLRHGLSQVYTTKRKIL